MKAEREIFVFGSNMAGRHGKGAAFTARKHYGAVYGQGVGLQGDSYAIPTKDFADKNGIMQSLPLHLIKMHVDDFIRFAKDHPTWKFKVTAIGTGLARYSHGEIAPMFADAPSNCRLPVEWRSVLGQPQPQPQL